MVASIRALAARGVGSKRIAATLGEARNTVKRYLRTSVAAGEQERPQARKLSTEGRRWRARSTSAWPRETRSSWSGCWPGRPSRSACARSSARSPICDAPAVSPRSRRFLR